MKEVDIFNEITKDLSLNEMLFINGGGPDRNTSIFYDVTYYVVHGVVDGIQFLQSEGVFTKGWWEDWALDTF